MRSHHISPLLQARDASVIKKCSTRYKRWHIILAHVLEKWSKCVKDVLYKSEAQRTCIHFLFLWVWHTVVLSKFINTSDWCVYLCGSTSARWNESGLPRMKVSFHIVIALRHTHTHSLSLSYSLFFSFFPSLYLSLSLCFPLSLSLSLSLSNINQWNIHANFSISTCSLCKTHIHLVSCKSLSC